MTDTLRVFYSDPEVLFRATVAYVGLVLYASLASISDASQARHDRVNSALGALYYFAALPMPSRSFSGWAVLQHLAGMLAIGFLGPSLVHSVLLDERALRPATDTPRLEALTRNELLLVYAPALFVTGWPFVDTLRLGHVYFTDPARGGSIADQAVSRHWLVLVSMLLIHMAAGLRPGLRVRRIKRGIRVAAPQRWVILFVGAVMIWGGITTVLALIEGPDTPTTRLAIAGILLLAMTPGLVGTP